MLRWCILFAAVFALGCQAQSQPSTQTTEDAEIVAQEALAGVGKEGQSLQNSQGVAKIITGPFSALANFKQKAALEMQVKPALNMFRATNGRFPNSHEEFMEQIVKVNRIQLPELPEGAVYHFNSEKGELWVYPEDEVPTS